MSSMSDDSTDEYESSGYRNEDEDNSEESGDEHLDIIEEDKEEEEECAAYSLEHERKIEEEYRKLLKTDKVKVHYLFICRPHQE